ncbi:hypothetical protein NQT74_11530 [Alteromonas stellipolaris]|uniref:hypothetical protein n=1 Tax=Alteromonas stellipolaris TaxID=233316 RepID=UPI002118B361|nr:hypothetical protein [Alteromonas stellipolaris]MCQ8849215.1 hypothetical protein [Alteromonas stellipolaris]
MSKATIFTWPPLVIGVVLLVVAKIDMVMFDSQTLNIGDMLSLELPIVLIGMFVSFFVFISSIYWLYNKKGKMALQAVISPVLFLVCMSIGGVMGLRI